MQGRPARRHADAPTIGPMTPADEPRAPEPDALAWQHPQPFVLSVTPGPADIDGLLHTNNAVYVRWCEQAGWAHSEHLGLSLADYQRLNRAMAIRHASYDYRLPTLQGEALLLGTWLRPGDGRLTLVREFQLVRPRDAATVLCARWELVCIDIASGRPRRMPEAFEQAYGGAAGAG